MATFLPAGSFGPRCAHAATQSARAETCFEAEIHNVAVVPHVLAHLLGVVSCEIGLCPFGLFEQPDLNAR